MYAALWYTEYYSVNKENLDEKENARNAYRVALITSFDSFNSRRLRYQLGLIE